MAGAEFANCFSEKVGVTVDVGLAFAFQVGEDALRSARDIYNRLSERDKAVVNWVGDQSQSALGKILEKLFGVAVSVPLLIFLGGVSWGVLIGAFIGCADKFL